MKKFCKIFGVSTTVLTVLLLLPAILLCAGIAIIIVGTIGINVGAVLAVLVILFALPLLLVRNCQYKSLKKKLRKLSK